jgi:hypothetical protein
MRMYKNGRQCLERERWLLNLVEEWDGAEEVEEILVKTEKMDMVQFVDYLVDFGPGFEDVLELAYEIMIMDEAESNALAMAELDYHEREYERELKWLAAKEVRS